MISATKASEITKKVRNSISASIELSMIETKIKTSAEKGDDMLGIPISRYNSNVLKSIKKRLTDAGYGLEVKIDWLHISW